MKRMLLVVLIAATVFYFYSCRNTDLRGWWKSSDDGKTYLVVTDSDAGKCPPIFVNGVAFPHAVGEIGEINPGDHKITCGTDADPKQGTGFTVREGTTYHFDYWGP